DRLLHGLVGHGHAAVRLHQTDGEEVLVSRRARGFPGQKLVKGLLTEDTARRIHEIGHGRIPSRSGLPQSRAHGWGGPAGYTKSGRSGESLRATPGVP